MRHCDAVWTNLLRKQNLHVTSAGRTFIARSLKAAFHDTDTREDVGVVECGLNYVYQHGVQQHCQTLLHAVATNVIDCKLPTNIRGQHSHCFCFIVSRCSGWIYIIKIAQFDFLSVSRARLWLVFISRIHDSNACCSFRQFIKRVWWQ